MSRGLLGATMYIEKRLQAAEPTVPWSREEQKRVTEYLADFRKFKNGGKRKNDSGEEVGENERRDGEPMRKKVRVLGLKKDVGLKNGFFA